jgi:hypothetical protein
MRDLKQYFGAGGAFEEACKMYQARYDGLIAIDVLKWADE